jgi:hypothetical protein
VCYLCGGFPLSFPLTACAVAVQHAWLKRHQALVATEKAACASLRTSAARFGPESSASDATANLLATDAVPSDTTDALYPTQTIAIPSRPAPPPPKAAALQRPPPSQPAVHTASGVATMDNPFLGPRSDASDMSLTSSGLRRVPSSTAFHRVGSGLLTDRSASWASSATTVPCASAVQHPPTKKVVEKSGERNLVTSFVVRKPSAAAEMDLRAPPAPAGQPPMPAPQLPALGKPAAAAALVEEASCIPLDLL